MGCILVLIALAVPRVLMAFALLLTDWFGRAFETRMWPILGFVFMPYTTLAYMGAMLNGSHTLTGGWLALFIAEHNCPVAASSVLPNGAATTPAMAQRIGGSRSRPSG